MTTDVEHQRQTLLPQAEQLPMQAKLNAAVCTGDGFGDLEFLLAAACAERVVLVGPRGLYDAEPPVVAGYPGVVAAYRKLLADYPGVVAAYRRLLAAAPASPRRRSRQRPARRADDQDRNARGTAPRRWRRHGRPAPPVHPRDSTTRLVEAISNAIAALKLAPLRNSERASATAA